MDLEAAEMDVALVTLGTLVRPLPGMQSLVQLQVHKLRKLGRAHLTLVRFFSRMQSKVGLEIACAAKSLVADLQVGELTERLGTDIALILDLAILFLQRVRKSLVTSHVSFVFNEIHGSVSAGGRHH